LRNLLTGKDATMGNLADNGERLSWIFGSSRSGSTWLLRMLSDFDSVVPINDPHLGHHLGVWRPIPLAWAASEAPPEELTTLLELKADEPGYFFAERYRDSWWEPLRDLIRSRFEAQAEEALADRTGTLSYVVKEPGSHAAPLLAELFPDSKLIFLLRDGRDVVDSWLDGYRNGSWAIPGGAFPVSSEGRLPLIRWLSAVWVYRSRAVQKAFESRQPENRLLVRYETLREHTATTLAEVCEVLGLERGQADEIADCHRFDRVPQEARGQRHAVRAAKPGSWLENLSHREQEAMHEALGPALEEFGYYESSLPERAVAAVS
jgi:sulfotransferase family protein